MAQWQKGDLDQAMQSLKLREKLCRGAVGYEQQLSGTLVHQSFIYQLRGEDQIAAQVLKQARKISKESVGLGGYQSVVGELGLLLLKKGDLDGAMAKFKEQERICRQLGDLSSLVGCLGNLGAVFDYLNSPDNAMVNTRRWNL